MNFNDPKVRVLVIGGNGQDGRIILDYFRNLKIETLGISARPLISQSNEYVSDFSNLRHATATMDSFKPTHIFHLAAVHGSSDTMLGVESSSATLMHQCHVEIVANLIEWAKSNPGVRIVVGLSSQMYTPREKIDIINENTPASPQNLYGQTKFEGFTLLREARVSYKLHISGAILFNHSSELSKPEFLFPQLATQLSKFQLGVIDSVEVRNAGALISVGDAREFCDALVRMSSAKNSGDYIIAYPSLISIEDLIYETARILKLPKFPKVVSISPMKVSPVLLGNIEKATADLDWCPTVTPIRLLAQMTKMGVFIDDK